MKSKFNKVIISIVIAVLVLVVNLDARPLKIGYVDILKLIILHPGMRDYSTISGKFIDSSRKFSDKERLKKAFTLKKVDKRSLAELNNKIKKLKFRIKKVTQLYSKEVQSLKKQADIKLKNSLSKERDNILKELETKLNLLDKKYLEQIKGYTDKLNEIEIQKASLSLPLAKKDIYLSAEETIKVKYRIVSEIKFAIRKAAKFQKVDIVLNKNYFIRDYVETYFDLDFVSSSDLDEFYLNYRFLYKNREHFLKKKILKNDLLYSRSADTIDLTYECAKILFKKLNISEEYKKAVIQLLKEEF